MRKRITPSLVISLLALAVALGGVSYAAIKIPRNSVGTAQIKKKAVTTAKLKQKAVGSGKLKRGAVRAGKLGVDAVNSAKVRDGSLLRDDFAPGQLAGEAWYSARETDGPLFEVSGDFTPVVTTQVLPPGSYVLAARANVIGGGGVNNRLICSMENDAAQNFNVSNGDMLPLSMSAAVNLAEARAISLSCSRSAGSPRIAQAHIIATQVTQVTGG